MDFTGKVALITGASAGMGRAAAVKFAKHGASVVVNYAKSKQGAEETAAAIAGAGGKALVLQADVSKQEEAERLVAESAEHFGRLDILVNNAGTTAFIPFPDLDAAEPEIWRHLYATNVIGAFICARAAAKIMRRTGGGVIINNASNAGHRPVGSSIPYCVSKAAMLHMTKCLAVALGPDIRVNSVSPGVIADTEWNANRKNYDKEAALAAGAQSSLLQRVGCSDEIADAMLFLASDATFSTGIDIMVDGGRQYKA